MNRMKRKEAVRRRQGRTAFHRDHAGEFRDRLWGYQECVGEFRDRLWG